MPDEPKYFQMTIHLGIEANSQIAADDLADQIRANLAPLSLAATARAKVFETFVSQPYDYPD